jgi:hypothetical protein
MLIAMALLGLNLAGARATSRYYHTKPYLPVTIGNGRGYLSHKVGGIVEIGEGNAETGYRRTRIVRRLSLASLVGIWWPVTVSAAITLLVLVVARRCQTSTAGAAARAPFLG